MMASWIKGLAVLEGCVSLVAPAWADRSANMAALIEALQFEQTISIMQLEGAAYGEALAAQMVPDADPDSWADTVARIYDGDKMYALIAQQFEAELAGTDLTPLLAYYQSEAGAEIIALELSARRAFLEPEVEQMAADTFARLAEEDVPLIGHVQTLINDSDLVELNVMGALNSELMFYRGLNDGGAFDLTEDEILSDVWGREDELRDATRSWLESFLTMSYQPLDADALEAYAALWRTPAGRDLNQAIFAGFDQMYEEISYLLGRAVAREMMSEKL